MRDILELSVKMLNDFVSALVVKPEKKTEETYYGTIDGDEVILDGAQISTPCVPLVETEDGDRVVVLIKDNTCYITGIMR